MKPKDPKFFIVLIGLFVAFLSGVISTGQVLDLPRESLMKITGEWTGDRFPNGRPKVPDQVLERMKEVAIEEAWSVLRGNGYHHQFEGSLTNIHPERVLVGRAVTRILERHDQPFGRRQCVYGIRNGIVRIKQHRCGLILKRLDQQSLEPCQDQDFPLVIRQPVHCLKQSLMVVSTNNLLVSCCCVRIRLVV